ncbi:ribosomal RNA large subunit methyltransferase K/L [Acrasis kona]|uniref:Ribosomal RNA large subunit methyltransferase K/L n=1 Tax=Acrasis kona TaxID=1008807 RepID=A0AAW2YX52_9EUKA
MNKSEKHTFSKLRELDVNFWKNFSDNSLAEKGYQAENMHFYGEIGFLLKGLKHCVMFSGMSNKEDDSIMNQYINEVLNKSSFFSTFKNIRMVRLHENLEWTTPNYDASGEYVMWREDDANQKMLSKMKTIFLDHEEKRHMHTSERIMSDIFDYPYTLPDSGSQKVDREIAYLDVDNDVKRVVTTYGSVNNPEEMKKVAEHFLKYKKECGDIMNLSLEIMSVD